MDIDSTDLTSIALVTSVAVVCGLLLSKLRQPAIVGYVLAGIALGPSGLALIKNTGNVEILAELGVLMLLFVIGTELSVRAFVSVLGVAMACAALQIALSLGAAYGFGHFLGWPMAQVVLIGFLVSLSSTAVAVKMLEETGELRTDVGRLTVGTLVAQDLAVVPMLLLIPVLGGRAAFDFVVLAKLAAAMAILAVAVWLMSRSGRFALPLVSWFRTDAELQPLAVLAICFSAATLSGILGLTPAYGAFLAGLVLGNSTARAGTIRVIKPIQSVLLVVFFLSIGLMIDLKFIWNNLGIVLALLAVVTLIKTVINIAALRVLGQKSAQAFPAGILMGQIGEFSFVIAAAGLAAKAIDRSGYRLAISVIALSLLISPIWLLIARRFLALALAGFSTTRGAMRMMFAGDLGAISRAPQPPPPPS